MSDCIYIYNVYIALITSTTDKCHLCLLPSQSTSYSQGGHRGRHHMVVKFTATCAISAYCHWSYELKSYSWQGVLDTTLCDDSYMIYIIRNPILWLGISAYGGRVFVSLFFDRRCSPYYFFRNVNKMAAWIPDNKKRFWLL